MTLRLLDLYCCQGGASAGFAAAGFDVTGVDLHPQPRYPYRFVRGDAIAYLLEHGHEYDLVAASPPCQRYTNAQRLRGNDHPDLIGPTREAILRVGRPGVIENVGGARAELRDPVLLCGPMLGVATYRHRWFETVGDWSLPQLPHPPHDVPQAKMGRPVPEGWYGQYVGNFTGVARAREVLGVPWMSRDGIRECIPPAYAEWIGRQFIAAQ
ncbi:SAM-dependent methyltransferase [Streptomyces albidoflavus]